MRQQISSWAKRNISVSGGSISVRPGLKRQVGISSVLYGFSVRDEYSDETWHYVVTFQSQGFVYLFDDRFNQLYRCEWGKRKPTGISHAVVSGQVIICAENMPTLWSYTGQALIDMKPKAWDSQPELDPLEIPQGLVTEWAGRAVYSDGGQLYFSEGGEPRMLFADNVQNPPGGRVVGMHTMKNGALLLATTTGTWALNREAAMNGEFILGVWQKLNDHQSSHVGSTVSAQGRVWGTSRNGLRLIDTDSQFEADLNDPPVPMTTGDPVSIADFRPELLLFEGEHGVVASCESIGMSCFNFAASRDFSWWSAAGGCVVKGQLRANDGTWLPLLADGIYTAEGTTEQSGTVYGVLLGRANTPPERSPVVRAIHISTDSGGSAVCALRGEDKTSAVPQSAPVWDTAVYGTDEWSETEMRSRRFQFATRTDDIAIEIGCSGPQARIDPAIDIDIKGVGPRRPTN